MQRRQWFFLFVLHSSSPSAQVISLGASSPSHTCPTQVWRGGWLTGFWLEKVPLQVLCDLMIHELLSQTQKPLNTSNGVFGFEFFLSGAFGEEQQPSVSAIQKLYITRAAVLRRSAKEHRQFYAGLSCPRGTERWLLEPHLFRWDDTKQLLTRPKSTDGQALYSTLGWFQQPDLRHHHPVPLLACISLERTIFLLQGQFAIGTVPTRALMGR